MYYTPKILLSSDTDESDTALNNVSVEESSHPEELDLSSDLNAEREAAARLCLNITDEPGTQSDSNLDTEPAVIPNSNADQPIDLSGTDSDTPVYIGTTTILK